MFDMSSLRVTKRLKSKIFAPKNDSLHLHSVIHFNFLKKKPIGQQTCFVTQGQIKMKHDKYCLWITLTI